MVTEIFALVSLSIVCGLLLGAWVVQDPSMKVKNKKKTKKKVCKRILQ